MGTIKHSIFRRMLHGALLAWIALLGTSAAKAAVMSEQEALNRAWASKLTFATENAVPSWVARSHGFLTKRCGTTPRGRRGQRRADVARSGRGSHCVAGRQMGFVH